MPGDAEAIQEAVGHGVEVAVGPILDAIVSTGETYIRKRSEVGLAIKAQTAERIADDLKLGLCPESSAMR